MGLIQNLKDAFFPPKIDTTLNWEEDLIEAAYVSPQGTRQTFDYMAVSRRTPRKTAAFEFASGAGTYVQDNGTASPWYPMTIYFHGTDHHKDAADFIGLLKEPGFGQLEHPRYGVHDVVPFGEIGESEDLVNAMNQTVIQVLFRETTGILWPLEQVDPAAAVAAKIEEFNLEPSLEIETNLFSELAALKDGFDKALDNVDKVMGAIAKTQADIDAGFQDAVDSLKRGIDTVIGAPLTLAAQTKRMIQAPGRALTSIKGKLDAYKNLAGSIFSTGGVAEPNGNDSQNSNAFQLNNLFAAGAVSGSVVSVVNHQFETKQEVFEAAANILQQFDDLNAWKDDNYTSLSDTEISTPATIDTGGEAQKLQEAVALAAGYLLQLSFTLKPEQRYVLDRDRTMIDLVWELYGEIDPRLDEFIAINNLSGDEHLELKRGREVVYYV